MATFQSSAKSSVEKSNIIGIQFSLSSPEDIRKNSVVEVSSRYTYNNDKPIIGGLFDPRMGTLEPGYICPTDGLNYIHTPGYFGHIELARPVFFIQHLKEIMDICKCVCFKCSRLLINKTAHKHLLEYPASKRWKAVLNKCKNMKRCGNDNLDGCGTKQPSKIKQEGMATLLAIWESMEENEEGRKEKIVVQMTPEDILQRFKRISDEDVEFMGFSPKWSRPDWMICTVLPVPPPAMRPSVKHDAQQRSEDDITHIYSNIIKTNTELNNKIKDNASSNIIEQHSTILQYYIAMIVNNKTKGSMPLQQRSGRPLQCIMSRINSKTGRIRGNLMGKRVNYSARSVITGDPNLSIQELGVPMKIAKNITKPEIINERNRAFLTKLVLNGPDVYPGAKTLERKNGTLIALRNVDRETIQLYDGDIVNRHMMDGDCVLFNRQPSLHRMSMMAHIVRVMEVGDTFRINVSVTKPYNADFDGDEMNMHMGQNALAEMELKNLANIANQIISPAKNSPIIGIFQDSLLGSYRLTRKGVDFDMKDAMNLLMKYPFVQLEKLKGLDKMTNFQILSQIMPAISIKTKTKLYGEGQYQDKENYETSNNVLEIRNGEYIRGQIEGSVLAGGSKGLIHRTMNDYSPLDASNFIDHLQNIVTEYMKTSCFSVGVADLIANTDTIVKIKTEIEKQKHKVQDLMNQVQLGVFENNTSQDNMSEFEAQIRNALNDAINTAGKIGRSSLNPDNRFIQIITSGSKGSLINLSQMISCVGQQNVEGKRVPYGFDNRTLPHYSKYDDTPNARGFIENSYISGLTAEEVFFHAMAGRIGLIDTACKTSTTGYIQRRLIKGLEDLKVEYDMTVRNNKGKIIQFQYGEDGFDSIRVENQPLRLVEMSLEEIYAHYNLVGVNDAVETSKTKVLKTIYNEAALKRFQKQKKQVMEETAKHIQFMIESRNRIVVSVFKEKSEDVIRLPVAFQYIINNIQGNLNLNDQSTTDLTPWEAIQLIDEYFKRLESFHYIHVNPLFKTLYYFFLSPRELLEKKRFHRNALITLLETVLLKYKQAFVHPGEMVGVVAGQSIGEPTTQLTLNTFHQTGSTKANATRGVPRIEEILRLTKNPKKPSITIFLKGEDRFNKEKASHYAKIIKHTRLADVVKKVEIVFDPMDKKTVVSGDQTYLDAFYEFEKIVQESLEGDGAECFGPEKSKWILRMEMNEETLLENNITMDDIHYAIKNSQMGRDNISCIYSDFNADQLVFRISVNISQLKKKKAAKSLDQSDDIYLLKIFQESLLNNIVLRGVSGIRNVLERQVKGMMLESGKYVSKNMWVLDTTGTNLLSTLALDYIDIRQTFSNDIAEIFDVLGIEATRQSIYNEIREVMEASDGIYINYHHLGLLADRMTCNHNLVPIFRTGILADDIGPIAKATFEVQTDVFLQAARHGELDNMRGVSANVMCGQTGKYGTHSFELILDLAKFRDIKPGTKEKKDVDIDRELYKQMDQGCSDITELKNQITNLMVPIIPAACGEDNYDMGF